jgi:hypothetical protein
LALSSDVEMRVMFLSIWNLYPCYRCHLINISLVLSEKDFSEIFASFILRQEVLLFIIAVHFKRQIIWKTDVQFLCSESYKHWLWSVSQILLVIAGKFFIQFVPFIMIKPFSLLVVYTFIVYLTILSWSVFA